MNSKAFLLVRKAQKYVVPVVFILVGGQSVGIAQERTLATHGDEIEFTIDSSYICSDEATINITTARADNFEQDDLSLIHI